MSEDNNVEDIEQRRADQFVSLFNDANISHDARATTLPRLGQDDIREYVRTRLWETEGSAVVSIVQRPKNAKVSYSELRCVFHTLAKEILLSHHSVFVTSLSNLIAAIDHAQFRDADVWLDEYQHLFVTNFFTADDECPLDATQRQRVRDFIESRIDAGVYTHVQLTGINDRAVHNGAPWYGESWWHWLQERTTTFEI